MIILTFRPLHGESPVLVRGEYFRICADGTLRGPHNDVVAAYADGLWRLRNRQQRAFECSRRVYLRVTDMQDRSEYIGPYDFVRAADGALFTLDSCLGDYSPHRKGVGSTHVWREVAILSAPITINLGPSRVGVLARDLSACLPRPRFALRAS